MSKRTRLNRGTCTVEGCGKDAWARGYCGMHYRRWNVHGDPLFVTPVPSRSYCTIDGCDRTLNSSGLCSMHIRRLRKFGSTDDPGQSTATRFWAKVNKDGHYYSDLGKCWEWQSALNEADYGVFYLDGRVVRAHRWSFEQVNGSIPEGFNIDHRCGNTRCVNPGHLRPATAKQNTENWTRMKVDNKTGYRGVYRQGNAYIAQVTNQGRTAHIGSYSTAAEAGEAARKARLELHTYNDRDKAA